MRTVVRARFDEKTKNNSAAVLSAIGPTVSDAFRLMMVRTAAGKCLPFEPLVPGEKTVAAMEAARRGNLFAIGDGLMADAVQPQTPCGSRRNIWPPSTPDP